MTAKYVLLCCVSVLAWPSLAFAQAEPAPAEPALDQIVVTAQKREENLQDVPISVTAVSGEALVDRGVVNIADLGAVAPAVNIRINNSSFLPYIRGIGSSSGFSENPTGIYVDGVYVAQSRGGLTELNDISQIAVLKGPQGTLFGRNSTAGVIQITTRAPSQEFRVEGSLSYDTYSTLRADAYVTGGLTDDLAFSLTGQFSTQGEGWGTNLTTGDDTHVQDHRYSMRAKLEYRPGPDTRVTLSGNFYNERYEGIARVVYPGTKLAYNPTLPPLTSLYDTYSDTDGFNSNKGVGGSLTIDQNLGFADLLSITSYRRTHAGSLFDNDITAAPLFTVAFIDAPTRTYTQELQLSSNGDGPLTWVVGAFYFNNQDKVDPSFIFTAPPFSPTARWTRRDSTQNTESLAGFAQATWEFMEGTSLTVGGRYTWEKRDFAGSQLVGAVQQTAPGPLTISTQTVREPTWRLALDHQFGPDVLGYVSYSTGFKSGGYNLLAPTRPPFNPEFVDTYEAGLKTELFDGTVRFNAAVFYNDYSDILVTQVINNTSQISNAAAAETYGLDMEFQALLADNFQLSGGAVIMKAQYTDYIGAQLVTPLAAGGVTLVVGDATGNRLPNSQEFNASIAADYDLAINDSTLHFNVNAAYQGDFYLEPDNFAYQPDYLSLNGSLRYTFPNDDISITVFGRNLTAAQVITAVSATAPSVTAVYDFAPRTFGAMLRFAL